MAHQIVRINDYNTQVELFVDGVSCGIFPTEKRANIFLAENIEPVTLDIETTSNTDVVDMPQMTIPVEASSTSDIASQKNDEVNIKRRGRPRKAGNKDGRI